MSEELRKKFLTRKRFLPVLKKLRHERKKIVFTNGCFDLLHAGHIHLLQTASSKGDVLIVGLNNDASVRKIKGKGRPIFPLRERAEILCSIEYVDFVIPFHSMTPASLIADIVPDILVKGSDWKSSEIVGKETVEKEGGRVISVPLKKGMSTSILIERIVQRFANEV